jgi:putative transposase
LKRAKFSPEQIEILMQNPYVKNCTKNYIAYTTEAKIKAMKLWNKGETAISIFRKFNFPEYIVDSDTPRKSLQRWKTLFGEHWKKAFRKWKKWRPKSRPVIDTSDMNSKEYINYLETELLYFKKENELLKSLKKNEPTKSQKFRLIYSLSSQSNIKTLCYIAKVSLPWYYAYRQRFMNKNTKEHREQEDLEVIKEIALKWRRRHGYRKITMILHNTENKMNHKKVYRLMKKYDYLSISRRPNQYKGIMKATLEHRTTSNILNREFRTWKPFQKLWTDITYLKHKWKNMYLSVVKDMISWEILSNHVSWWLTMDIIWGTLKKLETYGNTFNVDFEGSIIHSDQWIHYTHPYFIEWVKKLGFIQSMSRKWNCIDNAPTESFFWHMKDEIDISKCKNIDDIRSYIDNYMKYYNYSRPQWNKKKMTPIQFREHLLSKSIPKVAFF